MCSGFLELDLRLLLALDVQFLFQTDQRVPSSRSFSRRRIILPEAVIGT